MTAKTEKTLRSLISISRKVKAQGHDLFVSYSPHVEKVEWRLFVGGWKTLGEATEESYFYSDRDRTWASEEESMTILRAVLKEHKIKVGK